MGRGLTHIRLYKKKKMGKGTVNHRPPALIIAVCFTFYNHPAAKTLLRIRFVILNLITVLHPVSESYYQEG